MNIRHTLLKHYKIAGLILLLCFLAIITYTIIAQSKSARVVEHVVKIEDCFDTGFGWSKMYTPLEK